MRCLDRLEITNEIPGQAQNGREVPCIDNYPHLLFPFPFGIFVKL